MYRPRENESLDLEVQLLWSRQWWKLSAASSMLDVLPHLASCGNWESFSKKWKCSGSNSPEPSEIWRAATETWFPPWASSSACMTGWLEFQKKCVSTSRCKKNLPAYWPSGCLMARTPAFTGGLHFL